MLTCRQATQLLSERQDRPLNVSERTQLTLHTFICSSCREYGKQMKMLSKLSKKYTQLDSNDQTKK